MVELGELRLNDKDSMSHFDVDLDLIKEVSKNRAKYPNILQEIINGGNFSNT